MDYVVCVLKIYGGLSSLPLVRLGLDMYFLLFYVTWAKQIKHWHCLCSQPSVRHRAASNWGPI